MASYSSDFYQINAEFQLITTLPLETNFMVQLDNLLAQLTSVFQKKGDVSDQKLPVNLCIRCYGIIFHTYFIHCVIVLSI